MLHPIVLTQFLPLVSVVIIMYIYVGARDGHDEHQVGDGDEH